MVSSLNLAADPKPSAARGDLSAGPPGSSIQALLCSQKHCGVCACVNSVMYLK